MPSFVDKLRLDNLYPTVPINTGDDPLFGQFLSQIAPLMNRNRIEQIGNVQPRQIQQPPITGAPQNVVLGDQGAGPEIAKRMLGVGESITPYQKGQLALGKEELEFNKKKTEQTNELNQQKLADTQRKTDIADFKAKNPGVKILAPKGGRIQAINSATGQVIRDFGDTGTLSDEDRINLEQSGAIAQIGARGANEQALETTRQKGRESLEEMNARHAMERAELSSNTQKEIATNKPLPPSQEKIAKTSRAQTAKNTHPEWAKYITMTPGGGFFVTGPSMGGLRGPTPEIYKAINDFIESGPAETTKPATTTKSDPLGLRK
jgi:hypothetical protein